MLRDERVRQPAEADADLGDVDLFLLSWWASAGWRTRSRCRSSCVVSAILAVEHLPKQRLQLRHLLHVPHVASTEVLDGPAEIGSHLGTADEVRHVQVTSRSAARGCDFSRRRGGH